jgi:hypothetical protein
VRFVQVLMLPVLRICRAISDFLFAIRRLKGPEGKPIPQMAKAHGWLEPYAGA